MTKRCAAQSRTRSQSLPLVYAPPRHEFEGWNHVANFEFHAPHHQHLLSIFQLEYLQPQDANLSPHRRSPQYAHVNLYSLCARQGQSLLGCASATWRTPRRDALHAICCMPTMPASRRRMDRSDVQRLRAGWWWRWVREPSCQCLAALDRLDSEVRALTRAEAKQKRTAAIPRTARGREGSRSPTETCSPASVSGWGRQGRRCPQCRLAGRAWSATAAALRRRFWLLGNMPHSPRHSATIDSCWQAPGGGAGRCGDASRKEKIFCKEHTLAISPRAARGIICC